MFWDLAKNHILVDHKLVDHACNKTKTVPAGIFIEESKIRKTLLSFSTTWISGF